PVPAVPPTGGATPVLPPPAGPVPPAVVAGPVGPGPAPTSPARRQLYSAKGRSVLPAVVSGGGLTEQGFLLLCMRPALTEGVDGTVFELPGPARREPSSLSMVGDGITAEVAFYASTCRPLGRTETTTAGPELPVPDDTRFVVVSPRSGGNEFGIVVHARG
ncbi:MAG: hypothetical protein ACT4NY_15625, partial [Pseudonocardiales bacterium]